MNVVQHPTTTMPRFGNSALLKNDEDLVSMKLFGIVSFIETIANMPFSRALII